MKATIISKDASVTMTVSSFLALKLSSVTSTF